MTIEDATGAPDPPFWRESLPPGVADCGAPIKVICALSLAWSAGSGGTGLGNGFGRAMRTGRQY